MNLPFYNHNRLCWVLSGVNNLYVSGNDGLRLAYFVGGETPSGVLRKLKSRITLSKRFFVQIIKASLVLPKRCSNMLLLAESLIPLEPTVNSVYIRCLKTPDCVERSPL